MLVVSPHDRSPVVRVCMEGLKYVLSCMMYEDNMLYKGHADEGTHADHMDELKRVTVEDYLEFISDG